MKNCQDKKEHWLVVKTKPRQERRAHDNLINQDFISYLPTILVARIQRGKRQKNTEAMFPGYVFVKIDELSKAFYKIRSTYGVSGVVRFGDNIATLSSTAISELKKLEKSQSEVTPDSTPNVGDRVEITQGPFKGISADITELKGDERCIVLINWLGQQPVKAEFSYAQLNKS